MREIRTPSAIPVWGAAGWWLVYCLCFPLYNLIHWGILLGGAAAVYGVLSVLFPGETRLETAPQPPVTTGDPERDALLRQGEQAQAELLRLAAGIADGGVRAKAEAIARVTGRIFSDLAEDPDDLPQIRRFAAYYLPTTRKLLNAYRSLSAQPEPGENVRETLRRIEAVLDTTLAAFRAQLDALFANQALDIETDITVLEAMLKREGLTGADFPAAGHENTSKTE